MEEHTPIPPIPDTAEPRHCPQCGTRVANLATTCLMCGALLEAEQEKDAAEEEPASRFRIPWRGIVIGTLAVLAFVAGLGWLVRAQIVGQSMTPTPVVTPTSTAPATRPPRPTDTPSPTPTFTPVPPRVHQVESGESCASVAAIYRIPLNALVGLNIQKCGQGGIIRPGDLLLVPAPTSTPGPTPTLGPGTPLPTRECPIRHIVQPGETGLGIAEMYEVTFDLVTRSNPQVDFTQLQINQVLQIPCADPTATPSPTHDPNASPTPIPKYAAPALLSPSDGATLTGALVPLQWTVVSLLRANEQYAVRLRRLDIDAPVESLFTRTSVIRLGADHAPSPDEPAREYSWEVTVVRETGTSSSGEIRYAAASQPSQRRTFRWEFQDGEATPATSTLP